MAISLFLTSIDSNLNSVSLLNKDIIQIKFTWAGGCLISHKYLFISSILQFTLHISVSSSFSAHSSDSALFSPIKIFHLQDRHCNPTRVNIGQERAEKRVKHQVGQGLSLFPFWECAQILTRVPLTDEGLKSVSQCLLSVIGDMFLSSP